MWLLLSCGEPLTTIPPAVEGVQSLSQLATVAMPHRPLPPNGPLLRATRRQPRDSLPRPAPNNRLRRRAEADHAVICSSAAASHVAGGVGTPPTSQESAASLALVPNKCACREWPLSESAQVVEWPRPLCWGFRQCRPLKMCVMVAPEDVVQPMVALWAGELTPTSRRSPAPCRMRRVVKRPGCRVHLCLRAGAAAPPQQHMKGLRCSRRIVT